MSEGHVRVIHLRPSPPVHRNLTEPILDLVGSDGVHGQPPLHGVGPVPPLSQLDREEGLTVRDSGGHVVTFEKYLVPRHSH